MSKNFLYTGEFYWLTPDNFSLDYQWWKIYELSFPLAERDTIEQLKLAIKKNIARIGGYRIDNELVGIVVFYRMQTPAFAFLHFFAIAQAWRGKNLGSCLFKLIVSEAEQFVLQQSAKSLGLFWEIEDPEAALTTQDKQVRIKRIHFYQKLGGKLFQSRFIQPALNNQKPVVMQLMHNCGRDDVAEFPIAKALYEEKYHPINNIDNQQIEDFLSFCFPQVKAG